MKEGIKLIALLTTIQTLIERVTAQVPTNTGYHLFRDKVAVKARRIWRIPIQEQGRDLVRVDNTATGNLRYGTSMRSSGQKSFPEVDYVYSFDREQTPLAFNGPYYSMFKNDMGKYGWWEAQPTREDLRLRYDSIYNGGGGAANNQWANVRARIDTLTGECSHKIHFRSPYMIVPCYTQNSLHNTLSQPMVYDYYINMFNANGNWPISDQNYMNHTASDRGANQNGHGVAGLTVNMNHRLHTTSIRWNRNPNLSAGTGQTWWTLIWNGPYQGQLSQGARQPNGGAASLGAPAIQDANILYLRPFSDLPFLKTCRIPAAHFTNLRVIEDIVQPDPMGTDGDQARLFFIWLQTNGGTTRHRLSRCDIINDINLDPRIPPWGVSNLNCLANCVNVNLGTFGATGIGAFSQGGMKYVPRNFNGGTANSDFLIGVNQNGGGAGAGMIFRCSFNRDTMVISGCVSTQACQEQAGRGNFGYFSECRSAAAAASCGIYYMGLNRALSGTATGNNADLMNRVYCADIIKFGGTQPLYYRRHFTAAGASDVGQSLQTGVDSVGNSFGIHSNQEFYVYNSAETQPTATNQIVDWTVKTGRLYDRERANTFYDHSVTGKVVRVQDANAAEGNHAITGYLNQSFALPFRRRDWRGNALKVTPVGSQVNNSVLHVNDVHMDNTEDWRFRDQIPMGSESLRVRRNFDTTGNHHLEMTNCWMNQHNIVTLNCTFTGTRHPIGATEHIKRVWWNEESVTVLTAQSIAATGNANPNPTPLRERSRLYCYRKRDNSWSAHDFGQNTNNVATTGGVVEHIDVVEHEGDLFVAIKSWSQRFVTRPVHIFRAPDLNIGPGSWTSTGMITTPRYNYNPRSHPTGVNGNNGYTTRRFFPLEDDSCFSGFNFVKDTSLKLRYLLDCNRIANSRDGADPANNQWGQTKWIGDYYVFDSDHVFVYDNVWNVTLRPTEESNVDYLGSDYEYGCATKEYVFMFDTAAANGWTVAAVHMRDKSMRFFDLGTFGITGIRDMICVGDYAVISASCTPATTPSAIIVLYGTMLEDARRRIHSIERYPGQVTSVSPTLVDDKMWIRYVMNNRPYYRVAYLDGPIVVYNSTRTQFTNGQIISHTNGFNPVNTTANNVNFVWANNEVNMTQIKNERFNTGSYNLDQISNITGHVYGANLNGINANLGSIRQRVYFERDFSAVRRDRRVLNAFTTGTSPALTDNRRRFTEMKVKGTRMCRLSLDQGYTRFHYSNDPFNSLRNYKTGFECELLDFSIDQPTATITQDRMYWGTVCQETRHKEVRIYRLSQTGVANAYDGGGKIVHNDDIHRFSMDHISYQHHLLGFYNQNDRLLNLSIYNLQTGITAGVNNHHADIPGPIQSVMQQNISDYSVFQSNTYTAVAYAPIHGGQVKVRSINKASNTFTSTALGGDSLFDISTDLGKIEHMDCTNSEIANSDDGVHCVFVGPDRRFYHYMLNHSTLSTPTATSSKWTYNMFRDYEAMDVKIGSQYIIMKAKSRDWNDNTVLTYLRKDKGGDGFLYSGLNGTTNGFNKWDWGKSQVELAEFGGAQRIFVQRKQDTHQRSYLIENLRMTMNNNDWHKQKDNCIHFTGAENTKCVPVSDIWYRDIPNHPGPAPAAVKYSNGNYWLKVLLWVLAALLLLGVIGLVVAMLAASPKPGYKMAKQNDIVYQEDRRPRQRVVEETVEYRGGRSSARNLNYTDRALDRSQEQLYGDFAL